MSICVCVGYVHESVCAYKEGIGFSEAKVTWSLSSLLWLLGTEILFLQEQ